MTQLPHAPIMCTGSLCAAECCGVCMVCAYSVNGVFTSCAKERDGILVGRVV